MAENDDPTLPSPDPGELLARAMHTDPPSGAAGGGRWTPPTAEELAELLPQFRIDALLGHGGMGAVYRGVQVALDRQVAIKLLPIEISTDPAFTERFVREAKTLARLSHPNIVAIHDFGTTSEGHLYFVMEFVEGTDLHRMIHGPGLTPAQSLEIIIAVCEALQYAHGKGVVHRDIKPANVLVSTEGRVKVADFGLARRNSPDAESDGLTMTGTVMGTMAYMAPEQTRGMNVDQRADIYSLGVMFYEMLCREVPRGVFEPPSRKVQVDVRIDEVVLKAMHSEPERRYQNTGEMKTDVERIRTTPAPAVKAEVGGRKTEGQTPRTRIAVIIAVCLALAGATGFFIWKKAHQPGEAARMADASGRVGVPPAGSGVPPQRPSGDAKTPPDTKTLAQIRAGGTPAPAGETPTLPGTNPAAATKDAPFVNTLGMKFVPVPITGGPTGGQRVLFSVWETRAQDYEVFAKETKRTWTKPQFEQGPTHPVVRVDWPDAKAFCAWLTERDRKAGRLGASDVYRLPSDHEWSCAAGIGELEAPAETPAENDGKLAGLFPWGSKWPPADASGNYAGEETSTYPGAPEQKVLGGYRDGFAWTSPVGSFAANPFGLYDLSGNVSEWCEDRYDGQPTGIDGLLRGGAWNNFDRKQLLWSRRIKSRIGDDQVFFGFRVVLAPVGAAQTTTVAPAAENWVSVRYKEPKGSPTTVQDGWIVRRPGETSGARLLKSEMRDGAVRAEFRTVAGQWSGDLWLRKGDRARYAASRNDHSVRLTYNTDHSSVTLKEFPVPALPASQTYVLELRAVGRTLTVKLDEKEVIRTEDDRLTFGTAAIFVSETGAVRAVEHLNLDQPDAAATSAPTPQPASNGAPLDSGAPIRIWDAPEKLPASATRMSWQDGVVVMEKQTRAVARETGTGQITAHNLIVRYSLRMNRDADWVTAYVRDSGIPTAPLAYKFQIQAGGGKAELIGEHGTPNRVIARWKLPRTYAEDEWVRVELRSVGNDFTVSLDGQPLGTVHDDQPSRPGFIGFSATGKGYFRDLEYVPLDATPATATKENPFVAQGGMQFVPVPITGGPTDKQRVLFSIWETRVQDYEIFAKETKRAWPKPDFEQGPTHPAVNVSWEDATAFCAWLTERHRKNGRLGPADVYRLPTDHEWSCAVGIGEKEDAAKLPQEKDQKIADTFPWGSAWPPPDNSGNYWSEELRPLLETGKFTWITGELSGYRDGFATTAPVGRFAANRFGLHDFGGNAWEWCDDWFDDKKARRVMRGASWSNNGRGYLLAAGRNHNDRSTRDSNYGFRVVLVPAAASAAGPSASAGPAEEKWVDLLAVPARLGLKSAPVTPQGFEVRGGTTLQIAGSDQRPDGAIRMAFTFREGFRSVSLRARGTAGFHGPRYSLAVRETGEVVLARNDNEGKDAEQLALYPRSATLRDGADCTLELRAVGKKLRIGLNGAWLGEVEDATIPSGFFGLSLTPDAPRFIKKLEYLDLGGSAPAAQTPQPGGVVLPYAGHRYQYVPGDFTWAEAKAKAEAMGGYLAMNGSKEETQQIIETIIAPSLKPAQLCWLGASAAKAGEWKWVKSPGNAIIPWSPGEPSGPYPAALHFFKTTQGSVMVGDSPQYQSNKGGFLVEWDTESGTGVPPVKPVPPGGTGAPSLLADTSANVLPNPGENALGARVPPSSATKDAPFVNTLGMKFVPVPITYSPGSQPPLVPGTAASAGPTSGQRGSPQGTGQPLVPGAATSVLFSVWETRVQDYEVFVKERNHARMKTPFAQSGTHPVAAVSWEDAQAFCRWLTDRERASGQIAATEAYRLPRDHEWSCAVGIGTREDAAKRPDEKSLKIDGFPWGGAWPPPPGTGNFAGEERRAEVEAKKPGYDGLIAGYNDGFHGTAPVGSFAANALGLFDLAGNVAEHCEDWNAAAQDRRTVRGGGGDSWGDETLRSSGRYSLRPTQRWFYNGFRVVLAPGP